MQRIESDEEFVRANYKGDPNIGIYLHLTDNYLIAPQEFKVEIAGLPKIEMSIAGTHLIGLFVAGNSNCLLVPDIIEDYERDKLDQAEINYHVLDTDYTALGNLILANSKGALISEKLKENKQEIEQALQVKAKVGKIADLAIPGSAGISNEKGVLIHRGASEEELENVEDALKVEGDIGSVNFGSPYVGTGLAVNSKSLIVGDSTKGPELGRITSTLGLMD